MWHVVITWCLLNNAFSLKIHQRQRSWWAVKNFAFLWFAVKVQLQEETSGLNMFLVSGQWTWIMMIHQSNLRSLLRKPLFVINEAVMSSAVTWHVWPMLFLSNISWSVCDLMFTCCFIRLDAMRTININLSRFWIWTELWITTLSPDLLCGHWIKQITTFVFISSASRCFEVCVGSHRAVSQVL